MTGSSFSLAMLGAGIVEIMNPAYLVMMTLAVVLGIMFGATPGISSNMGVILLMPATFSMDPMRAMALLLSVYVGGMSGGLISAILLNIPGTPASIATAFDGAPMAAKGQAGKALGVGILTSFVGGMISFIVLMLLSPVMAQWALKFGPYEMFSVGVFSLTLIGSVIGGSILKGLLAASIGMCLSFIGLAPLTSVPRMTFGFTALDLGIDSISLMIGAFAIPELLSYALGGNNEKFEVRKPDKVRGFGISAAEYLSHWKQVLQSGLIGIAIGILPGIGGNVSNLLAYISVKNTSKYPEKFGTGIVDGIIASETANNATIGGALVTMLALGIPGSTTTAILMSGLTLHGLQPGPMLFMSNPDLIYVIFAVLIVCNVIMIIVETLGLNLFTKLIMVPKNILLSVVAMMCFVGAYASNHTYFSVGCVAFFGILGYFFKRVGIPRAPMILGYILCPIVENNLQRAMMSFSMDFTPYFTRPISLVFFIATVISLFFAVRKNVRQYKAGRK